MFFHWASVTIVCVVCVYVSIVSGCPCRNCDNNNADCSNKGLRNPPKNIPAGTQIINLNSNRFSVLGPRSFQRLSSVEVVKARSNRIRVIRQNAFRNFRNLMTLDVSNNQIVKIYGRAFNGMNNLQTLTLSNNRLRSTSRIFSLLPRLYQLNLAFNQIRKLGERDFANNANIHQIDLRNNKITSIHRDTFKNLVSLRTLFLNNNPIATLPTLNFGSEVLHLLDLSECLLTEIPTVLPSSIGDLRLGKNQLTRLNQSDLANVTGLKMITLNDNNINIVEYYALGNAKSLREVWLRGNKMVYIPRGLPDSVKQLHMDSNTVYQIEGRLFSNNSQLEFLDISNNQVTNISSEAFSGLKKLRTLNFQGNQLQSIKPGTFVNLRNLTFLNLANNPIEFIEDGAFSNLGNLSTLNMNYNPMEEVQFEENFLGAMPNLKTLNLMASSGVVKTLLQHLETSDLMMEHVEKVILTYNNIHKLSPNFREVFPNVRSVQLDGNAWICDDKLLWLRQWMESVASEITFHAYSPAQCETPFGLNGQEILQVPQSSFVAPDENLLNDFPYWLIEEEFQESAEDEEDAMDKPKEKNDAKVKEEHKPTHKGKNHSKDKLKETDRSMENFKDKGTLQNKEAEKHKLKDNMHEIKGELKNNDDTKDKLKDKGSTKYNLKDNDSGDPLKNKDRTNKDKESIKDKVRIMDKKQAKNYVQNARLEKPSKTDDKMNIKKRGRKHKRNKKRRRKSKFSGLAPMDKERKTRTFLKSEEQQLQDSTVQGGVIPPPNIPAKEFPEQQNLRKKGRRKKGRGRKNRKRGEGKKRRRRGRRKRKTEKFTRPRI